MNEFNPVTFNRIKGIAKQKGYSLLSLNDKAKLGKNVLYGWKTKKPSYDNVKSVADVLGVSVDYLLGNTDEMHTSKNASNTIDLDKALSDKGVVMKFQGRELSDKAKRGILDILNLIDGDKE